MKMLDTLQILLTGSAPRSNRRSKVTRRDLIEREAIIGGALFGPVPSGHRREFFRLDSSTWIWHEEWIDEAGQRQVSSTRYEVHNNGILKAQDGNVYKFIEGEELRNLTLAIQLYYEKVSREIYGRDPVTGLMLSKTPVTI